MAKKKKKQKQRKDHNPGMGQRKMLSLLEHPPEFKVDRNYEIEKERIEEKLTRTEREEKAWKQEQLQVQANRFIIDTRMQRIHDRSCPDGLSLPKEQFCMTKDFDRSMKLCKACRLRAVVRQLTYPPGDYKQVLNLLESCDIDFGDLMLLLQKGVKVSYITYNILGMQKGEERWRVEKLASDRFSLYHNNYILEESRRRFIGGFHPQKIKKKPDFHNTIMEILRYNSDFHIEKILDLHKNLQDQAIEQAPENQLLYPTPATVTFSWPTIRRFVKKEILFDYYMYVDCKDDFAPAVFRKRRIWSIKLYEQCGITTSYKLVFCKILKFQHRRIFSAVNEVKKYMYKKHYQDGYIAMETASRYFAERGMATEVLKAGT